MEITGTQINELKEKSIALLNDAQPALLNAESTEEEKQEARRKVDEAMGLKTDLDALLQIKKAGTELLALQVHNNEPSPQKPTGFKSFGEYLVAVYEYAFQRRHDPRLKDWGDPDEPGTPLRQSSGWDETKGQKDLVESVGASGGFLVPVEQGTEVYFIQPPATVVRERATILPMRRRTLRFPTLDQTGTTSGQPHWWGGVLGKWTEETTSKSETEPTFRQTILTAHKLVCYTEAGDELLEDAAVSLEALLASAFQGTINWYEEEAFVNGTGTGQPLGVIGAPATITVNRAGADAIAIGDVINMLESFQGVNPVWFASQQALSNLMLLNGPAANPSYVFMPSARETMPHTLFGYPLIFNEHCPALGTAGDLILADWSKYLIGDRQSITVDSSKHYRFQNDITAWRAVHRVDGRPWLSAPLTYGDGTTQVSPFVILGDVSGS
jgi:HK97 family phage major capsid protein